MIKIRYFHVRTGTGRSESIALVRKRIVNSQDSRVGYVESVSKEIALYFDAVKTLRAVSFGKDGEEIVLEHPSVDRYRFRILQRPGGDIYLAAYDPPRSSRIIDELLKVLFPGGGFFFEPVALEKRLLAEHARSFDAARLVSAKVKNFHVYDHAVGRLEITSRAGLEEDIAPFLKGKRFDVDSLTYEVTVNFSKGLVCYAQNGLIRMSEPIADLATRSFEQCLLER